MPKVQSGEKRGSALPLPARRCCCCRREDAADAVAEVDVGILLLGLASHAEKRCCCCCWLLLLLMVTLLW